MPGSGATVSVMGNKQQCQLYSWGRPLPICRRFDLPQNCESCQYSYFLTQHQATSAEWPSNTRPDCERLTPKVSGVLGPNKYVVKNQEMIVKTKKNMILNFTDRFQVHTRLQLKSQSIEVVTQMKILGATFTDRLFWNENSDSIIKQDRRSLPWPGDLYFDLCVPWLVLVLVGLG